MPWSSTPNYIETATLSYISETNTNQRNITYDIGGGEGGGLLENSKYWLPTPKMELLSLVYLREEYREKHKKIIMSYEIKVQKNVKKSCLMIVVVMSLI